MNYRMVKAAELLKLTSLSIADIGSAIGYENQLHFSRAFKNIYGVSPREWRNQHKIKKMPSDIQGMMSEDIFLYDTYLMFLSSG